MKFIDEKEIKFQSELVNKLSWTWIIVNAVVMVAGIIIYTPTSASRWITNIVIVTVIGLTTLALSNFNYTKIAAYILPGCMFLFITYLTYTGGGTLLPGISNFIPIVLTTGFLLGRKSGIIMAVLCIATTIVIAMLETRGLLPEINFVRSPIGRTIALILPISIAAALQYIATKHISDGLITLQNEIEKRQEIEKIKDETVYSLKERIKELKLLYKITGILHTEDSPPKVLFQKIVEALPDAWQYPEFTAARICIAESEYATNNFMPSQFTLSTEINTQDGTKVKIEVVYLNSGLTSEKDPFLPEEYSLIDALAEMIKIDLESKERKAELNDYKTALDIASIVSISDSDANFLFVNENFCKASKYSPEELLGKHHSIIWSGIHSPEYFNELTIAMKDGKPFRGEFCNKAKDGTLYWVDSSIVPFLDEQGEVYQYLSINHDITERKKATELFNYQFFNSPDIILIVNKDFVIETINRVHPGKADIKDIIGLDAIEILPPESREISRKALIKCFESGENQEFENALSFGRWVNSRMVPMIREGEISHVMIFASDATKRKVAEEKIIQSEQLLKKITSQVPGNTYMFEIEESGKTKTHFFNKGSEDLNQILDQLDPNSATEKLIELIHEDDKSIWTETMKQAYVSQSEISVQYRISFNNQIRWRWFRAVPEKTKDGKTMWYGSGNDITPIVDYIASIEQIIFDISHVMRRPVATMMGLTKIITDHEISENEVRDYCQKLNLISAEMDEFIHELNLVYNQKRKNMKFNIDISSQLDERDSLFS